MKILIILIMSAFAYNSFAGDAGYMSETCHSASKRTVFSRLNNWSDGVYRQTLIIDGVPALYELDKDGVTEDGDDGFVSISKNGVLQYEINTDSNGNSSLVVHQDPRTGTIAENNALATPFTVSLDCKSFWPEP